MVHMIEEASPCQAEPPWLPRAALLWAPVERGRHAEEGDLEVAVRCVLQWKLMPLLLLLEEHALARDRPSQGPAR